MEGHNKSHRGDRSWVTAWSPAQIANRFPVDFPDDESMRISHEAIYQALYVESRGALKRELVACLRSSRALRGSACSVEAEGLGARHPRGPDRHRPAEADDRAVPSSRAKFMIRNRDDKFSHLLDVILADAGIQIVLSGVQTPRMNSIIERWIQTCRHELLDPRPLSSR